MYKKTHYQRLLNLLVKYLFELNLYYLKYVQCVKWSLQIQGDFYLGMIKLNLVLRT